MVQQLSHSQERKDLPFLIKFLLHIMKPEAAFAVTWYDVSYMQDICIVIFYYYYYLFIASLISNPLSAQKFVM